MRRAALRTQVSEQFDSRLCELNVNSSVSILLANVKEDVTLSSLKRKGVVNVNIVDKRGQIDFFFLNLLLCTISHSVTNSIVL